MSFVPNSIEYPNNSLLRAYTGGKSRRSRRTKKASDGKYHIHGQKFKELVGSRRKVFNETAHHTPGGLTKKDLFFNRKTRRIVSRKRHTIAKREKRLEKYGYFTKKGVFGAFRKK